MNILTISWLMNSLTLFSIFLGVLLATALVLTVVIVSIRWAIYPAAIDVIEIRRRWKQSNLDIQVSEQKYKLLASLNEQ